MHKNNEETRDEKPFFGVFNSTKEKSKGNQRWKLSELSIFTCTCSSFTILHFSSSFEGKEPNWKKRKKHRNKQQKWTSALRADKTLSDVCLRPKLRLFKHLGCARTRFLHMTCYETYNQAFSRAERNVNKSCLYLKCPFILLSFV